MDAYERKRIVKIIKYFLNCNAGDGSTERVILAIGCEIFDVSEDKLIEMMEELK